MTCIVISLASSPFKYWHGSQTLFGTCTAQYRSQNTNKYIDIVSQFVCMCGSVRVYVYVCAHICVKMAYNTIGIYKDYQRYGGTIKFTKHACGP